MKFLRLHLTNIGAFYSKEGFEFDLTTSPPEQNVVLLGGQNGSGKTTILEAIRIALFGPLAFGYKTDTASYYEKITTKLNTIALKNNENNFKIVLDIELVDEKMKRAIYSVERFWNRKNGSIKEHLIVRKNDRILTERKLEIFQTKLREETPPQLFELCLFDGERISQIIPDETLPSYLKETAKVMFNLDLFENLEFDLTNLIKQESIYSSLSLEEKELHETEQLLESMHEEQANLTHQCEQLAIQIKEKQVLLADKNKEFEIHGGLVKERREELVSQMNDLEQKRRKMMDNVKESIVTVGPFLIVKDLLDTLVSRLNNESIFDIRNNVKELIGIEDISKLVSELEKGDLLQTGSAEELTDQLYKGFLSFLATDTQEIWHHASYQQRAEVELLHQQVDDFNAKKFLDRYKRNGKMLKETQELRKKIDENDSATDLHIMIQTIYELQNEIQSLQIKKDQLGVKLTELQQGISQKEQGFENLKTKVVRAKKAENVFVITSKVMDVSRSFRTLQLTKKLQQVEWETIRMLQTLFRKELFVDRVTIHPESFQLQLFNAQNEEINKDILSAGEKQILLLSTVWAMVKCSKKRVPFVFDTLLGRLDQSHRKSLIQELIPNCGEQVIILSTDSEITSEDFKLIQPIVARTYTIDFNTTTSTVDLSNDYFSFSSIEVN